MSAWEQTPLVTVVLAVLNGEDFLPAARAQLEALTYDRLEILVVDDGSTDATPAQLADWADADPRVRVLRSDTNQGLATSRNLGVEAATGTWLWFTDVDDRWSPAIVERLVRTGQEQDADLVLCRAVAERQDGTHREQVGREVVGPVTGRGAAVPLLLRGDVQGHLWNKLFHRSLFDTVTFPLTRRQSDLAGMGWLLAAAERVAVLPETLYTYVIRPGSQINNRRTRSRDALDVQDNVRRAVGLLPTTRSLRTDLLAFEFREIYLAALHDQIRRDGGDADAAEVLTEIRSRVTWGGAARLVVAGHARVALPALLAVHLPGPYGRAYRAFRRRKWGSVQFF